MLLGPYATEAIFVDKVKLHLLVIGQVTFTLRVRTRKRPTPSHQV